MMTDQTETFVKPSAEKHKRSMSGILSVRGIIVLIVILTVCYMSLRQIKIDEPLYTLVGMVVAYYFGQNQKKELPPTTPPPKVTTP